jgi:tetratricopeptide (TPR) repeat protein
MARTRPAVAAPQPANPWLFNAPIDLLIGAGAWTLPLLAFTWFASRHTGIDVAFAFTALTLICNHPHYMATIHRAYVDREALVRHRRYTVCVTVLLALILVVAHTLPALRPLIVSAYLYWSPWHYTAQSFGLALLFARRNGISPTPGERRWLYAGFVASYGVWLLASQARPSDDPYVLSLAIGPLLANPLAAVLAVFMLGAFAGVAMRSMRTAGRTASAPTLVLCSTQVLWFVAPWAVGMIGGPTAPSLYYTTGGLAFMHCAQYLWVTAYYTRAARRAPANAWSAWRYALVLVLGGIALFIPGPWIASSMAGIDLRESIIIFTAIVNLHHFVLDGALWKLRDPGLAAILVRGHRDSPRRAVPRARSVHPGLQWGLAVALLAIAAVDLCQRALTRDTASSRALALAHDLNAHDTRVDVRRAALLARIAQRDAAIELLRPIVAANPLHAPAQRLLASLLLAEERWGEADALYGAVVRRGGLDAAEYINLGVLRVRANDVGAAESAFRSALALDPTVADAHLNLAEALWRQGRRTEAIAPYEQYLAFADPHDAHGQRVYLVAALKLAEAHVQAHNVPAAVALLERTSHAAEHIEAWDLAVLGHSKTAQLLERDAEANAVVSHYESAIRAAQRGGDSARADQLRARHESYLRR